MDLSPTLTDGTGLGNGQTINLLTEMLLGTHTFAIAATDNLGNAGYRHCFLLRRIEDPCDPYSVCSWSDAVSL